MERTNRGKTNGGLAKDLRSKTFASRFLLAAIDEGVSSQVALGRIIRAMGVKEFAASVDMVPPIVLRAISSRHNPAQDTLNRLLRPFRLRLSKGIADEPIREQLERSERRPLARRVQLQLSRNSNSLRR